MSGLPETDDQDAELIALEAAIAEARADSRPPIPHAVVRREMLENIERAERRIAALKARRTGS